MLFDVAHLAVLVGEPPRTIDGTRHVGKILDGLESISDEAQGTPTGRKLHASGGSFVIEDAAHSLLIEMIATAGINNAAARYKSAVYDLVKAAPEYTAPPPIANRGKK